MQDSDEWRKNCLLYSINNHISLTIISTFKVEQEFRAILL